MKNYIPKYLTEKQNVIHLVLGTSLFAELFILIYRPFGSRDWVSADVTGDFIYVGYATMVVLVAMGVIAASRTIMYYHAKKHDISQVDYGIWLFAELAAMSLIYTLFAIIFEETTRSFFDLWKEALIDTAFILFIPYALFWMYFSLRDKTLELQRLQTQNRNRVVVLKDEKGEVKISLSEQSVYYIESADNYVVIHYMSADKVNKYVLRASMKNLDKDLNSEVFMRIHRSYIVNVSNIKVLEKQGSNLVIDFGQDKLPTLPVSKTYANMLQQKYAQTNINVN